MKTLSISRIISNQQSLRKCESTFISLVSRCSLVWHRWLSLAKEQLLSLKMCLRTLPVPHQVKTGPTVSLIIRNKRHLVGIVMLLMGVGSIFAHQFLFDPWAEPHDVCKILGFTPQQCIKETGWCYLSWFYYWHTIRLCVAAIFGAIGMILFIPTKHSLSFIPFSILQAFGWIGLIHFSFFARSFETYHAFPAWEIIVIGFALGFAIVMSTNYLTYWYNHKALGNWSRYVGVTEMQGLTPEQKEPIYQSLAKEFRQIQKTI